LKIFKKKSWKLKTKKKIFKKKKLKIKNKIEIFTKNRNFHKKSKFSKKIQISAKKPNKRFMASFISVWKSKSSLVKKSEIFVVKI